MTLHNSPVKEVLALSFFVGVVFRQEEEDELALCLPVISRRTRIETLICLTSEPRLLITEPSDAVRHLSLLSEWLAWHLVCTTYVIIFLWGYIHFLGLQTTWGTSHSTSPSVSHVERSAKQIFLDRWFGCYTLWPKQILNRDHQCLNTKKWVKEGIPSILGWEACLGTLPVLIKGKGKRGGTVK